jgi:hypothetical protein
MSGLGLGRGCWSSFHGTVCDIWGTYIYRTHIGKTTPEHPLPNKSHLIIMYYYVNCITHETESP